MIQAQTVGGEGSGKEAEARPLKNVQFCSRSRKAKIFTTGIHSVFRGLEFEPDAEIGQKRAFYKGLEAFQELLPASVPVNPSR